MVGTDVAVAIWDWHASENELCHAVRIVTPGELGIPSCLAPAVEVELNVGLRLVNLLDEIAGVHPWG